MLEGLYFEDFVEGKIYCTSRRTVTETDHGNYVTLCGFFEQLFIDQGYLETETPFKGRIVPGALVFSFAEGMTILSGILHKTAIAFLGAEIEILKPVIVGNTISVEISVLNRLETKKTDRGIITFLHKVMNQDNEQIMEYKIKRMMKRKSI